MPTSAAQIMILLPVFSLLAFVAMPVVAIALYGKFDGGESNVYPERHFRKLTLWRQTACFECSDQVGFYRTGALLNLLRKIASASAGTHSEPTDKRGFDLADFAAHFALHFDLWFVQRVVFTYDCFGGVARGALDRTTACLVVWRTLKLFAAVWAYLFNAWQPPVCRFVGLVGASAGTKFPGCIVPFMGELFATSGASFNGVLFLRHENASCRLCR